MTFHFNIEKLPGLDTIAAHLEGLEETIISKLIERAQFAQNLVVYQHGLSGFEGAGDIAVQPTAIVAKTERNGPHLGQIVLISTGSE